MTSRERIVEAAYTLAEERPLDQITLADVAEAASVHWTTVRRHVGGKAELRLLLNEWVQRKGPTPSAANTKTRILEAAARIFAEHGYPGASLEQVAAAAGLTKGAVYWHFTSKCDLFVALCDYRMTMLLARLPGRLREAFRSEAPMNDLSRLLLSQFASCESNSREVVLFFEFLHASREPAIKERLADSFAKLFDGIASIFREMQDDGVLSDRVDPDALSIMLQALINGLMMVWLIAPQRVHYETVVPEVTRVLWEGLQPQLRETFEKKV